MSQILPYMSPLRFPNRVIDYQGVPPTFDLMKQRVKYQKGVYPGAVYPSFAIGNEISIEIIDERVLEARIYREGSVSEEMTILEITPSGWTGERVWKVSFNITTVGTYRIYLDTWTLGFINSDEFKVYNWASDKNVVKVQYYDSGNGNGGVFYNHTNLVWSPILFYTGILSKGGTQFERSVYSDQPNNTRVLRATPKLIDTLIITDIHQSYYDNISYQFSCDTVFVNDTQYAVEEISEPEKVSEKSDLVNVTITLSRNTNNGFQQI